MPKSRTTQVTWREGRRLRAWELHHRGWSNVEIAEALGVSPAAVCQWLTAATAQGEAGLRARSRQGQGRRLSDEQLQRLPSLLQQGAEAHGFLGAVWTCRRIGQLIQREFGVVYHPGYVSRLMRRLKWTYQTPVMRSSQRDEIRIAQWLSEDWPAIHERAKNEGRTLVFVDESGFSLRPSANKTWSPAGRSPVLRAPLLREHLSMIGGLTWEGHLYTQIHYATINASAAIGFLRHLLLHIPGPLLMLWDSARIHKSRQLAEFRELDTTQRLVIEHFPGYAPEVDPQEYVWQHLKHVDLRNLTSYSLDQLWARLQEATNKLRGRAGMLKNLIHHAGLDN